MCREPCVLLDFKSVCSALRGSQEISAVMADPACIYHARSTIARSSSQSGLWQLWTKMLDRCCPRGQVGWGWRGQGGGGAAGICWRSGRSLGTDSSGGGHGNFPQGQSCGYIPAGTTTDNMLAPNTRVAQHTEKTLRKC